MTGPQHRRADGADDAQGRVVREAIEWYVVLASGVCTPEERQACARWCAADPLHQRVWQRLQNVRSEVSGCSGDLAAAHADAVLARTDKIDDRRRRMLVLLAAGGGAGMLAWSVQGIAPWRAWTADERTAVGEVRTMRLPDGTQLSLNTGTALDVRYDARRRDIALYAGEIAIESAPGMQGRPLRVLTPYGVAEPLGTRFSVQLDEPGQSRAYVSVAAGRVRLRSNNVHGTEVTLSTGESGCLDRVQGALQGSTVAAYAPWMQGMLAAQNTRLADFCADLSRYRPGIIQCRETAADLRLSGAFALRDSDHVLQVIAQTLPVRIVRRTRYWIVIDRV
ncbi:FecR domain-containing protein [Schauerella aestuarii]|uniref:FecR domain-containing protein n=1 Tax=Schauerella aestuarii TaxID=2511204 RepID=UPI0013683713|nr:FecR domain-containing protein [Achromobacter aestuarii]